MSIVCEVPKDTCKYEFDFKYIKMATNYKMMPSIDVGKVLKLKIIAM